MGPTALSRNVPIALALAFGVTAQETTRWDPGTAQVGWKEGERARLHVALWSQGRHAMPATGSERKIQRRQAGDLLLEIAKVDAEGRIASATLTLERFQEGETPLEGPVQARLAREPDGPLLLVLESTADGRALKARAFLEQVTAWLGGSIAAALGRPWVDGTPQRYVEKEELALLARAFVPGIDPTGQTRAGDDGLPVAATFTATSVKLAGKGPLPFATLPGAVDCELAPGSRSELELEAEWPRGRGPSQGRVKTVHRFAGKGKNRLPDGRTNEIEAEHEHRLELTTTLLD